MELQALIQKLLESNDFFDMFEEIEMQELLKCCKATIFQDGEYIFREEGKSSKFYIIINGSVVVTKKGKRVDIVREGECLGEMGAMSGYPRSASAEAIGKVTMLEIDNAVIGSLSPQVQVKLLKNIVLLISNRLRKRLDHIH